MLKEFLLKHWDRKLVKFVFELLMDDFLFISQDCFRFLKEQSLKRKSNLFKDPFKKLI